jgi:Fe-S-cluster containining protein
MREFMGFPRTICDCELCAMSCKFIPGYLMIEDLILMAQFLGYSNLLECAEENLLASPGALVSKGNQLHGIRTIVPARGENEWCRFFDGRHCRIHPVASFGCALFDSHQDPRRSEEISKLGLMCIAAQWRMEENSLYCKVWNHLQGLGLISPSPEGSSVYHAHC